MRVNAILLDTVNDKLLVATDGKVKQFKITEFNKIATDLKI